MVRWRREADADAEPEAGTIADADAYADAYANTNCLGTCDDKLCGAGGQERSYSADKRLAELLDIHSRVACRSTFAP